MTMSIKRILLSLGVIVFAGAVVAGATGAFFSDTETSTGNTFAAGAIDLKIDSEQHYNGNTCVRVDDGGTPDDPSDDTYEWQGTASFPEAGTECKGSWMLKDLNDNGATGDKFFYFNDLKPGDYGENTISLHLETNDAWMCASLENVGEADNGQTEPESVVDNDGDAGAELDQNLQFFAWVDHGSTPEWDEDTGEGDNVYQNGELVLGTATADTLSNTTWALADSTTGNGPISAGQTGYIGVAWCYGSLDGSLNCDGSNVGNESQTDSWFTDVNFYVEQSRNNENFTCNDSTSQPDITTTTGDGWSPQAGGTLNQDRWLAKARYGQNNASGAYELEVGFGPGLRGEGDHVYGDNVGETFTLTFDDTTKLATVTVGNDSTSYTVTGTPSAVGITAKGSASNGITKLTGATFNGNPIPDTIATVAGHKHTVITGAGVAGNFTLTGTLTLDWDSPADENPTLQVDVIY